MFPQGEQNIYGQYKGNMQEKTSKYHMKQVKSNSKFMPGYEQAKKTQQYLIIEIH